MKCNIQVVFALYNFQPEYHHNRSLAFNGYKNRLPDHSGHLTGTYPSFLNFIKILLWV